MSAVGITCLGIKLDDVLRSPRNLEQIARRPLVPVV
jgi:hypothetical protein